MKEIISIVQRQMKRYFRNKGVVIFSLLSAFIVSGLYMFFLADMQINYIKETAGNVKGVENMINTWIVGGLVCIPAISVPLIMLCFKVDDFVDGTEKDIMISPAKRTNIMFGYIISAFIVGFAITVLCLIIGELFIVAKGGSLLSFSETIKILGILGLLIFSFTGFEFFITLFMKTSSATTVVNSLLNVLLGFLLGLYIPIGMLSCGIATVIKSFPLLQASSIIRQIIMSKSIAVVTAGAPPSIINEIKQVYGVDIILKGTLLTPIHIIAILFSFGILFYVASIIIINHRKGK